MNIQQRESLHHAVVKINTAKANSTFFNEIPKNPEELLDPKFDGMSRTDITVFISRIEESIRSITMSYEYLIIPFPFLSPNGQPADLVSLLEQISQRIERDEIAALSHLIRNTVRLLLTNGIWYKFDIQQQVENFDIHSLRKKVNEIHKLEEKIKRDYEQINSFRQNYEHINSQFNTSYNEWQGFKNNSEKIVSDLNATLVDATKINGQIQTLKQEAIGHVKTTTDSLETLHKNIELGTQELRKISNSFNEKTADAVTEYDKLVDKRKGYEKLSDQLDELIGKKAASNLFTTFNSRKEELDQPVHSWKWIVFITSATCSIIILLMLSKIEWTWPIKIELTSIPDWKSALISIARTSPFLLLIYFTISQYNRERMFQEEYAFRSTIALSIKAYAELAGEKKDDLFEKASKGIFEMPSSLRTKQKGFNLRSKKDRKIISDMVGIVADNVKRKVE